MKVDIWLYRFLCFAGKLLSNMPWTVKMWVAKITGITVSFCAPATRNVVDKNLKIILSKSCMVKHLRKKAFINMAELIAANLEFPFLDKKEIISKTEIIGKEHLENARNESSGGVIILTCHTGHWERIGVFLRTVINEDTWAFYLRPKQLWMALWLKKVRVKAGVRQLEREELKKSLKILKNGGMIGILADHDGGPRGIITEFFGKKASVPSGPAALALRTKSAILPCVCIPGSDNRVKLYFYEPVFLQPTKDRRRDLIHGTESVVREYEKMISAFPAHWLLAYDRFKPRRHVPQ